MRLRPVIAALVLAGALLGFGHGVGAEVLIAVNKAAQRMSVSVDGELLWLWPVSTGIARYDTPNGSYTAFRMEEDHYSREWDDAPMPHSIFFTRIGHAIHGTTHTRRIGEPASHGCVRLAPENAAQLFALVREHGLANTKVVVEGDLPPPPVVADRDPRAPAERRGNRVRAYEGDEDVPDPRAAREPPPRRAVSGYRAPDDDDVDPRMTREPPRQRAANRFDPPDEDRIAPPPPRERSGPYTPRRYDLSDRHRVEPPPPPEQPTQHTARSYDLPDRHRVEPPVPRERPGPRAIRRYDEPAHRSVAPPAPRERPGQYAARGYDGPDEEEAAPPPLPQRPPPHGARSYAAPPPVYHRPPAYRQPPAYRPPNAYRPPPVAAQPRLYQRRGAYAGAGVYYDPRVEVIEEGYVNGTWVRRRYYRQARPSDFYGWR